MNNLKCSIIQMLTFLYLRKDRPYLTKTHLFKYINSENNEENHEINTADANLILKTENSEDEEQYSNIINDSEFAYITQFIVDIFVNEYEKFEVNKTDFLCLIQFIVLIKYVLRHFYLMKDSKIKKRREAIHFLITKNIDKKFQMIN